MKIEETLSSLEGVRPSGPNKWKALCPAHDDKNPSLSIGIGKNGKPLMYCHAGCSYEDIFRAIGLDARPKPGKSAREKHIKATYDYTDSGGDLLFQKVRYHKKEFRIRRKNENGEWVWNMGGIEPVLYGLTNLTDEARASEIVYIVEGEKDADRLDGLGLLATCNFDGASKQGHKMKWRPEYNRYLIERNVVILADNDAPGLAHAQHIASSLQGTARSVKVVTFPGLPEGGDVSDWLDAGHTMKDLEDFCSQAEKWEPLTDANGWPLRTLKQAYEEQPPVTHLVEGLITVPSLTIFYGAPGTLKSMSLADMAVDVSSGNDWLPNRDYDGRGYKTIQSPVLCIDLDNGTRRADERFGSLGRERRLPADTALSYVCMADPPLNAKKEESMSMLANLVRVTGAKLVIIDNLSLVSAGVDENSAEMAEVMANFRRLAESQNVAITLIHHQRKGKPGSERLGDTLRGHSSIEASLDLALLVTRESEPGQVLLTATKTRGAEVRPIHAKFVFTHKPGTDELETARFWGVDVKDTKSPAAVAEAIAGILSKEEQLNQKQLINAVKEHGITTGRNRIRDHIKTMVDNGQLIEGEGEKNACLYSLK